MSQRAIMKRRESQKEYFLNLTITIDRFEAKFWNIKRKYGNNYTKGHKEGTKFHKDQLQNTDY